MKQREEVGFTDFLRSIRTLGLASEIKSIRDSRESPEIPTDMIALDVILGAALGVPSLRQLDFAGHHAGFRAAVRSSRRQVASDTTISRVCADIQPDGPARLLAATAQRAGQAGALGMEVDGRRQRIGILDGSGIGGHLMAALLEVGEVPTFRALDPIPKRGEELNVALEMIHAQPQAGGLDYLMGDELYACERFFRACTAAGVRGVVKTKTGSSRPLDILRDADGLFDAPDFARYGVEHVGPRLDAARGCTYEVWAAEDLPWSQTDIRLKVTRVRERYKKGPRRGPTLTFYVLSQDARLSAQALRELGHLRWSVENHGFKALNEQARTKHLYSHDPRAALTLARLQMVGFLLISLYRWRLARALERMRALWDHAQMALRTLRAWLWSSLDLGEEAFDTG